ncbi:unnamed protein product [Absidia cylindrospora]
MKMKQLFLYQLKKKKIEKMRAYTYMTMMVMMVVVVVMTSSFGMCQPVTRPPPASMLEQQQAHADSYDLQVMPALHKAPPASSLEPGQDNNLVRPLYAAPPASSIAAAAAVRH